MDFSELWTKLSPSKVRDVLNSRFQSLSFPGDCLEQSRSYSLSCGHKQLRLSISGTCEQGKIVDAVEARSARVVRPGLREDEEDFIDETKSAARVCITPNANESETQTPRMFGERTVTASTDIESVQPLGELLSSPSAPILYPPPDEASCGSEQDSSSAEAQRQRSASVNADRTSKTEPTDLKVACPVKAGSTAPLLSIQNFAALLRVLATLESDAAVRFAPIDHLDDAGLATQNLLRGDIIYIEEESPTVCSDRNRNSGPDIKSSPQRGVARKTENNRVISARGSKGMGHENLLPFAPTKGSCSPRAAGGQTSEIESCSEAWAVSLRRLCVSDPEKKNCLAFYLDRLRMIVALKNIAKGERLYLYDAGARADLKALVSSVQTTGGLNEELSTSEHARYQRPAASGSASNWAHRKSDRQMRAEQIENFARTEMCLYSVDQVEDALREWPSNKTAFVLYRLHSVFAELCALAPAASEREGRGIAALLEQLAPSIELARPITRRIKQASSAERYTEIHGLEASSEYIKWLYNQSEILYTYADCIRRRKTLSKVKATPYPSLSSKNATFM